MARKVKIIVRFIINPDLQFVMKEANPSDVEMTDEEFEDKISDLCRYLADASYLKFEVEPANAGTTKKETVVLANEALKNAYLVVREIA